MMTSADLARHRMNRLVTHLHGSLDDAVTLESMASIACLSKYHFCRMFQSYFGQTPIQYVWRVRLERAARMLTLSTDPITSVALDAGFASSQSFSQAIRGRFGRSPREIKRLGLAGFQRQTGDPFPIAPFSEAFISKSIAVETVPAQRVAYIRYFGPYLRQSGRIPKAFADLAEWASRIGLPAGDLPRIGLCPDNRRFTPTALCMYDACIPVPQDIEEDDVVSIQTIPAGRYAKLTVTCSSQELLSCWEWLTCGWRVSQDEGMELRWSYELYPPGITGAIRPEDGVTIHQRLPAASTL